MEHPPLQRAELAPLASKEAVATWRRPREHATLDLARRFGSADAAIRPRQAAGRAEGRRGVQAAQGGIEGGLLASLLAEREAFGRGRRLLGALAEHGGHAEPSAYDADG